MQKEAKFIEDRAKLEAESLLKQALSSRTSDIEKKRLLEEARVANSKLENAERDAQQAQQFFEQRKEELEDKAREAVLAAEKEAEAIKLEAETKLMIAKEDAEKEARHTRTRMTSLHDEDLKKFAMKRRMSTANALESQKQQHEAFLQQKEAEIMQKEAKFIEDRAKLKAESAENLLKQALNSKNSEVEKERLFEEARVANSKLENAVREAENASVLFEKRQLELDTRTKENLLLAAKKAEAIKLETEMKLEATMKSVEMETAARMTKVHLNELKKFAEKRRMSTVAALDAQQKEHEAFLKKVEAERMANEAKLMEENAATTAEGLLKKAIASR